MSNNMWCIVCLIDDTVTGPFTSLAKCKEWIRDDMDVNETHRNDYQVKPFFPCEEDDDTGGDGVCEHCGERCEYDSTVCLCDKCLKESNQTGNG